MPSRASKAALMADSRAGKDIGFPWRAGSKRSDLERRLSGFGPQESRLAVPQPARAKRCAGWATSSGKSFRQSGLHRPKLRLPRQRIEKPRQVVGDVIDMGGVAA